MSIGDKVHEAVPGSDGGDDGGDGGRDEEEDKELMVLESYASTAQPGAMMIHPEHTTTAGATMMGSVGLVMIALPTEPQRSIGFTHQRFDPRRRLRARPAVDRRRMRGWGWELESVVEIGGVMWPRELLLTLNLLLKG